jgi:hypothetical protein
MSWKRFKRNDCPVCSTARKDCRQNRNNSLIHCRSSEADPADWIYRGEDQLGFFMWAYKPDVEAWGEEKREEWRREQELTRKQRKHQKREKQAQSLSAQERHLEIKKILSQLHLSVCHREQLRDRGLSDQQIKDGHYRSIEQWQKLSYPVSDRLAGVKLGGKSLVNPNSGVLCPILNHRGLFVAWQIRQDNNSDSKYIWAASESNRQNRPSSKTREFNELPLGIWQQPNDKGSNPRVVGLTEGTGIKPYIASKKLNITVIGASGGNFASSSQTLKASLKAIAAQEVIFYPDGGAVINVQIIKQYQKTFRLLQEWNYSVKIGWWNQIQKSAGDIDEVDSATISKIVYLSTEEFLKLVNKQQYIAKLKKSWLKSKQFTAHKIIHQQYFEAQLPASNTISFIKSTTGSGKTTKLLQWFKLLEHIGAIALGYRNTLLLQWCAQSKFYHLHEHDGIAMIGDEKSQIALCIDSLWRFKPEDFDGKILILDEVCSVIRHLLFSSTIKNREYIQNLFAEAIRRCDRLICLDGMMADWTVNYLTQFCPDKKVVTIKNTWTSNKAKVNFLRGTIDVDGKLKVNDRSPWLEELLNKASLPAIGMDSQVTAESLDNLLSKRNYKVLRVDSKTVQEDHVKEFLSNCDGYLKKHRPDVLIYTPSAESGVDVSITNYFSHHFCFFFGVLGVDSILQLIARIRDINCPKYFWCRERVSLPDEETIKTPLAQNVAKAIDQNLIRDIYCSLSGEDNKEQLISVVRQCLEQSKNAHWDCATKLIAINNYEKSNLRACVLESLKAHGYEVLEVQGITDQYVNKYVKEASEAVKQQNCHDIFIAEDLPKEQVDNPLAFDASWSDRCKLKKAQIKRRLPGIEQSDRWNQDLIYRIQYKDRSLITKQELFWLLNNPKAAQVMEQEKYYNLIQKYLKYEQISLWKIKTRLAIVCALRDLGIHRLLNNPDQEYTDNSPEIQAIYQKGKLKKYRQILERTPGKSSIRYVGSLLAMVGLNWESKQIRTNGERNDKRNRIYKISSQKLADRERLVILECIARKWEQDLSDEAEKPDWSTVTDEPNFASKSPTKTSPTKKPPTLTTDKFNPVTDDPNLVNKPDDPSVTEKVNAKSPNSDGYSLVEDWLDSDEAIAALAEMLGKLEDAEQLAELQTIPGITACRLRKAAQLLSLSQYRQIRQWATHNRKSTAS